jgi:hypothetical protein
MFSAVALVAFSFAGMANNEGKIILKSHPWVEDMNVLMDGYGATFEETEQIADQCFNECLDAYYPLNK